MSAMRISKRPNHMWCSALRVAAVKCIIFVLTVRNTCTSSMCNCSYHELLIILSLAGYDKDFKQESLV